MVARMPYIAALNVVACIAVVTLHTNGVFWKGPSSTVWVSANAIETLFYWAAPTFFMIAGATLFGYRARMTTREYAWRRIKKAVVPFLIWTGIAIVYFTVSALRKGGQLPLPIDLINAVIDPGSSRFTMSIYWFFPAIFGVYLAIPFLSLLDLETLKRLAIMLVVVEAAAPSLLRLVGASLSAGLLNSATIGYTMYAVLGYVLASDELPTVHRRVALYFAGICCWAIEFFGTLALSDAHAGISTVFKGYTSIYAVCQTVAVFVFVRAACAWAAGRGGAPKPLLDALYRVSALTYGVYLIHFYLILLAPPRLHIDVASLGWRLGGAVGIFVICCVVTDVLGRIPVLKRVLFGQ